MILQLLYGLEMKKKLRILVLTSSNAAVDIIAKRLLHVREKLQNNGLNYSSINLSPFHQISNEMLLNYY